MQQRKTISLIDLHGNPIIPKVNLKRAHLIECFIYKIHDIDLYEVVLRQEVGSHKVLTRRYKRYDPKENWDYIYALVNFINNQLTLARKGFETNNWNDFDIYQTTLGRYWEVPWYDPKVLEPKHEQNYNVRALEEYDPRKGFFDQEFTDLEGCQYCANEKEFTWAMFVHDHLVIGLDENVPQRITAMAIQPMLDDFLKHYPKVFSKLPPWKGQSTDDN